MKIIYEPSGRALEYSPLAANLYRGCGHGCTYCYAPNAIRENKTVFIEQPQPRKNVLKLLESDAKEIAGDDRPILLCFTCDPYQPIENEHMITRQAIKILHANDLKVRILTKGARLAKRDFDLLQKNKDLSEFGVSLTFNDVHTQSQYEPYADSPFWRINALHYAAYLGIRTWASLEPVIFPDQTINMIYETFPVCDRYAIGKLNHQQPPQPIDWVAFRERVVNIMKQLGKEYYIKKDLAECE